MAIPAPMRGGKAFPNQSQLLEMYSSVKGERLHLRPKQPAKVAWIEFGMIASVRCKAIFGPFPEPRPICRYRPDIPFQLREGPPGDPPSPKPAIPRVSEIRCKCV